MGEPSIVQDLLKMLKKSLLESLPIKGIKAVLVAFFLLVQVSLARFALMARRLVRPRRDERDSISI